MPTSYTTTVTVTGFGAANYGSQLDSLEIVSGSTNPYELPQPPSARASFLGLPVVSGVTQTPDWWIGKELTFTITPQGATGTVTWVGIVQSFNCAPVQTTSTDQIVELDLLGSTSRLSTEIITNDINFTSILGSYYWYELADKLNAQLAKTAWDEVPIGLTWDDAQGTWDTFTNNNSGLNFINEMEITRKSISSLDGAGEDMLGFITSRFANTYRSWFWFDNKDITLYTGAYTTYTQLTSLNAQSCVLWSSLRSASGFSNIINSAQVTLRGTTTTYDYLDATSYYAYGARFIDFGTTYDGPTTRELALADRVNAYDQPTSYLESLTINLDELTHVTGEWQNFYKSTKPVRLPMTNIPAAYGGNHTYMVRGVQLNLTNKHAEATLLVVPSTIYNPS